MDTYLMRVKQKVVGGKTLYQPQIKRKCLLPFFYSWGALSMLIFEEDEHGNYTHSLQWWTDKQTHAIDELLSFTYNHESIKTIML